ncbi:hypothetical protein [Catenulispora acidiphila]|uniref:hypothetical protein n=1 Tax=Catenulispora acidiphila TaxID=304895 RepID=UPI0021D7B7CB|nr:hypothetical protein [Catenulispora acidiphila]
MVTAIGGADEVEGEVEGEVEEEELEGAELALLPVAAPVEELLGAEALGGLCREDELCRGLDVELLTVEAAVRSEFDPGDEANATPATAAPTPTTASTAKAGSRRRRLRETGDGVVAIEESPEESSTGETGGAGGAGGTTETASATVEERASPAAIHSRYSVAISVAEAPVSRANFSMTPYSGGTVSPCTYRCSVEVPTCSRFAKTP